MPNYENIKSSIINARVMASNPNPPTNPNFPPQDMADANRFTMSYPEVFYKLQPFIMMACDQMDVLSMDITQDLIEKMTDGIYDDFNKMYPDMADYIGMYDAKIDVIDMPDHRDFDRGGRDFNRGFGGFRNRFRRRGPLKDLIEILLLQELARRRRRYY